MSRRNRILLILAILIAVDVAAFMAFPPTDPKNPDVCTYPVCFINGNLELPAPHAVFPPGHHAPEGLIVFDVSISSTLLTMWVVAALVILAFWALSRGRKMIPGRGQNVVEWIYESVESFGMSIGGPGARPYIPLFAGFFIFILFSNWSGLIPGVGKVPWFRAPTSDVNVTIGLALVSFVFFQYQGFKHLGIGYLGKFFPFKEFKNGIGAGIIAMFVGLIELLLEFVKPVTLSMRLFGNIYGGEVALGVMTALTIAIIPLGLFALEVMLNLVQALIFSTLTLMFTLAAIEHHGDEHDDKHAAHEPAEPVAHPVVPDQAVTAAH